MSSRTLIVSFLLLTSPLSCTSGSDSGAEEAPVGGSGSGGASTAATGGASMTGGNASSGGATGGSSATGANAATGGSAPFTGTLPPLHVQGNLIQDPNGKTIVLRGASLIDVGTLYAWGGTNDSASNITTRIDKILASGLAPHVLRLPVYPRTVVNMEWPYYSPVPFPVGPNAPAEANLTYDQAEMTPDEYFTNVLEPAVDYATSKGMYIIIDYHQIDDTTDQSLGDALAFWQYLAPKYQDAANVIYEAYNEPINTSAPYAGWTNYAAAAQQLVDTIRQGAANNLIILGSPSWCQQPGGAIGKVTGSNVVLSAHIYPGNWSSSFQSQIDTAASAFPVFISEWGYGLDDPSDSVGYASSATWGTDLQTYIDGRGASWTAWVTDDSWTPKMFSSVSRGSLTPFGTQVKDWLAATATSDWVE